ncbi:MAG: hypothetical protein LBM68_02830, partial [Bacteroidales bacterium]|nr:hypothetical protein [Bacteroidales bacterium]
MKHLLFLFLGIIAYTCLPAQAPTEQYIDARTRINTGIDLHDNEHYEAAIAEYRKVNSNDSLYVLALHEIALSYKALEKYEEALSALDSIPSDLGAYAVDYYTLRAAILNDADRSNEAADMMKEVYPKYSHLSNVGYSYALSLFHAGKYDEAEDIIQRAIRINPYHYQSHYLLGTINYAKGRLVPAMLCLAFATNLGTAQQCYNTLVTFENAMNGTLAEEIQKESKGGVYQKSTDAVNSRFLDVETMITSNFVLNKKFNLKTKIDLYTVRQLQFLVENVKVDARATDIYNQFYIPFFSALTENKYIEPYLVNSMRFSDDKTVTATTKKNKTNIANYLQWAATYIDNGRTHLFDAANKNYYTFYTSGIEDCGQYADVEQSIPVGTWISYYENGPRKLVINYSNNGKDCDFTLYNTSGGVQRKGRLKNDELDGEILTYYTNGVLSKKETFAEGKLVDTLYIYTYSGQLKSTEFYIDGKLAGERTTFFDNGQKEIISDFVDDELNGRYKKYFANGTLYLDATTKHAAFDGVVKYYYPTGAQNDEMNYSNEKKVGEQKEWYPNGVLKSVCNYNSEGLLSGWYRNYYSNGVLEDSIFYNDKGETQGLAYFYDTDGKLHYTRTSKNGTIELYTYYNKAGNKIHTSSLKATHFTGYYPNGTKHRTGAIKNGLNEDVWTTYDSQGRIWLTQQYSKDVLNGALINRYSNGTSFIKCNYIDGELDGYYVKYYRSGNVSSEGYYAADTKIGEWKEYLDNGVMSKISYYDSYGELQGWETEYTVEGKLKRQKYYVGGQLQKYVLYDKNEQILDSCNLKHGNGQLLIVFPNGQPYYKAHLLGGKYNGMLERYTLTGTLTYKGNYIDDKEDGLHTWYYADGKKSTEEHYVLGKKHGSAKEYYNNGSISQEEEYMLGTLQKRTQYYKNGAKKSEVVYDSEENEIVSNRYAPDGTFCYAFVLESGFIAGYTYFDA